MLSPEFSQRVFTGEPASVEIDQLVNYCTECGWFASSENYTRSEQAERAIEHYLETGHEIDSERRASEESETGWADEWPPTD